jgi:hypothetical protein
MPRNKNEERDLLNDLDNLLAGKQVNTEGRSEDERTALEFAKRYMECRSEPSAEFQDSLKRRLLLKLAQQEVKAQQEAERREQRWGWLSGFMTQTPARRAAIVAVIAVAITIGALWARGTFTEPTGPVVVTPAPEPEPPIVTAPPPPPVTAPVLRATATIEKTIYTVGEKITIEFSFSNISSESITIAPYPPQIDIRNAQTDETARRLPPGTHRQELAPSETVDYNLVWDQLDGRGHQISPGTYAIATDEVSITSPAEPEGIVISFQDMAEVTIQAP